MGCLWIMFVTAVCFLLLLTICLVPAVLCNSTRGRPRHGYDFLLQEKCFTCRYSKPTLMVLFHNTLHRRSQGGGGSWGARGPPFVSLLVSKQLTIFRWQSDEYPQCDPPFEKSWLRPCTLSISSHPYSTRHGTLYMQQGNKSETWRYPLSRVHSWLRSMTIDDNRWQSMIIDDNRYNR